MIQFQWVKSFMFGWLLIEGTNGFGIIKNNVGGIPKNHRIMSASTNNNNNNNKDDDGGGGSSSEFTKKRKRDKVMEFLRTKGVIGARKDFTTAMGVDEGPVGKSGGTKGGRKVASAFKSCIETGIIDDMSESFPMTSSGKEWNGFTDRVMGGVSMATLVRQEVEGRMSNVMTGTVSLANNGGFIQMASDLSNDPSISTVDASEYDGIELDVLYKGEEEEESFNVHLRNPACERQNSSYRATFQVKPNEWETIRLSWSDFVGHGSGCDTTPFSPAQLRRIGIVSIGKEMKVYLAVSGVRFYSVI